MTKAKASNSIASSDDSQEKAQTWRHPGGKLVELGSHTLKQAELLAILIGAGVKGRPALAIANDILDRYIGLYGIHREATLEDLAAFPGMGPRKAACILAAIELGRRLYRQLYKPKPAPEPEQPELFSPRQRESEPEPQGPGEVELLAAIIGSGIRGRSPEVIAEELLSQFGSFLGLFGRDLGDFLSIKGLNSVKIIRIAATLEIAKRLAQAIS